MTSTVTRTLQYAIVVSMAVISVPNNVDSRPLGRPYGSAVFFEFFEKNDSTVDSNKDGSVNRAEFEQRKKDEFSSKDKNGDQKLSREELSNISAATFSAVDKDGNSQITMTEINQVLKFENVDQNNDGSITPDEFTAFRESLR